MGNDLQKGPRSPLRDYAKYSGIAFQMMAIILLGTWVGLKADDFFHFESHILTIIFSFLSVILALWMVFKKIS